jgi:hypothetical protein
MISREALKRERNHKMQSTSNRYVAGGRRMKATKLAAELAKANITREKAATMTQADWEGMAISAGVNIPSRETVQLAASMLRSEAPVNDDPFAPWRTR